MQYRFTFVACLGILMASGCVYHGGYPYGYYNGNYGGNYGAGPSVLPPGQWGYPTAPSTSPYYQPGVTPYTVPGGTVPGGNPTPIDGTTPGGTNPPAWNNTNPPQTYDGNGGNAPIFNPNTPNTPTVPEPNDDPNGRSPGAQRPSLTPTSGASTRMRSSSDDLSTPFEQDETNRPQQNQESESVAENEVPYEAPLVRQISNTEEFEAQPASQLTRTSGDSKSPFGRDPKFQWIKGVLDYDDANKAYVVMYDDNPSPSDQLGGELTLGDHQALDRFRPNDAVRIEGYFDQRDKDANGKPVYVITAIKKQ